MLMFSKNELTRLRDLAESDMVKIQNKINAISNPKFDDEGFQVINYTPAEITVLQGLYDEMDKRYESYDAAQTLLLKYY